MCVCVCWGERERCRASCREGCAVCFIFVLLSPLVRGATLRLGIAGRMSSTSLIACIQQLVTLDGRVKLAVSGTREHSGGGWRMLLFFFLLIIQSSSLFSYYCGTWCCLYWVVLIFLPCSDLMWCPRRAEVISSLIPPFFLFPHFCKGAWERALSEGASPICMYITAIYVCLFFCVMSALQKLSNISFFPQARSFHFFPLSSLLEPFGKPPFPPLHSICTFKNAVRFGSNPNCATTK